MAKNQSARNRSGGTRGKATSSLREIGAYGGHSKSKHQTPPQIRRRQARENDPRVQVAQAEVAAHEAKLAALAEEIADTPHKPYRPNLVSKEQVAEYVERTTREQGVPLKVQDADTLDKVATLLRTPPPKPQLAQPSWQQMEDAKELLAQGYHVSRVADRTGVSRNVLRHFVANDGYAR